MWHVLEHTEDPIGELREIHRILDPTGRLFLAVPNSNCIMYWFWNVYLNLKSNEPHALWFNEKSLIYILSNNGFVVDEMSPDFFQSNNKIYSFINKFILMPLWNTFKINLTPAIKACARKV